MANTILVTVGSLIGVVLGGVLSLVAQRSVEKSAARRHAASIMEGSKEQLGHLIAFIETAQEAERLRVLFQGRCTTWSGKGLAIGQ